MLSKTKRRIGALLAAGAVAAGAFGFNTATASAAWASCAPSDPSTKLLNEYVRTQGTATLPAGGMSPLLCGSVTEGGIFSGPSEGKWGFWAVQNHQDEWIIRAGDGNWKEAAEGALTKALTATSRIVEKPEQGTTCFESQFNGGSSVEISNETANIIDVLPHGC